MPGLQTPPGQLSERELHTLLMQGAAILIGAAYVLYDLAIAMAMNRGITGKDVENQVSVDHIVARGSEDEVQRLVARQHALHRIEAPVSTSWVEWAAATNDNWKWMMARYEKLAQSYAIRFSKDPPYTVTVRELWMYGPRPRPPGRTPFPEEAC